MSKKKTNNYTLEHIIEVENRLCEYINAIESGVHELELCMVCSTVDGDCSKCLLCMEENRYTVFIDGIPHNANESQCVTQVRVRLIEETSEIEMNKGVFIFVTKCNEKYLKLRYKELCETLHIKE